MSETISKLQKMYDEALGEIHRLNVIVAACTCGGVPQALAQVAPPVTGNGGMQGQGQGTMLMPTQVTDQQAGISNKKKKKNRNKNKKEKKNELDLPVVEKNELDLPVVEKNELDSVVEKNELHLPVFEKNELHLPDYDSSVPHKKIGKLSVSDKLLGRGSNDTIVFEGIWNGRKVAVKRLLKDHYKLASKEITNYIASSQHTNVVTWYGVESDEEYYYLALELCSNTLHELILPSFSGKQVFENDEDIPLWNYNTLRGLIQPSSSGKQVSENDQDKVFQLWNNNGYPSPHLMKLIRDMVHGLIHLHQRRILHRDLKPSNVLILKVKERESESIYAKLSDMGISKRLEQNEFSIDSLTPPGHWSLVSSGWQAPEQLRCRPTLTQAVDIFSLGCVIFFSITRGKHPFGDRIDKNNGVKANKKKLEPLDKFPVAQHLVYTLLHPTPRKRPRAEEILYHPFFWDSETRLSFIRDANDYLNDAENVSKVVDALKAVTNDVFDGKWDTNLDAAFRLEIPDPHGRPYDYSSFSDLLRAIRNKWTHYGDLSDEVKEIVGDIPEGYNDYFSRKFPKLLIEVYKIFRKHCKEEALFKRYFKGNQV